jgi:hypothetical protein
MLDMSKPMGEVRVIEAFADILVGVEMWSGG